MAIIDPRLTLHESVISSIERIFPSNHDPDLEPGFLRFKDTDRFCIEKNPSSFEADQLRLDGFTQFFDSPEQDLRRVLFHVEVTLFRDSSPYEREKDYDTELYFNGLHSVIIGSDIPPTIVGNVGSGDLHDNPHLLREFLDQNLSEIISIEQARSVGQALNALTTANIDFRASI